LKVVYLLDTDWVIDYLNNKEPTSSKIEELIDEGIGISIISLAELYEGVLNSRNPESSENLLLGFMGEVSVMEIGEGICRIFGELRGKLRKKSLLIDDFDIVIASTAMYHEITLCTNNRKHYDRIEGLKVLSV
jgi:tRNA(fMet)-specific endonuclease VapC